MFQTGFPMTVLSAFVGPLRLTPQEREDLFANYAPWAVECGSSAPLLMNVMFEDLFKEKLDDVRKKLKVYPPRCIE
jgi:ubiquinone biosynthesis protein COQ4